MASSVSSTDRMSLRLMFTYPKTSYPSFCSSPPSSCRFLTTHHDRFQLPSGWNHFLKAAVLFSRSSTMCLLLFSIGSMKSRVFKYALQPSVSPSSTAVTPPSPRACLHTFASRLSITIARLLCAQYVCRLMKNNKNAAKKRQVNLLRSMYVCQ